MSYNKTQWINNGAPSISAENLNKIEQGIYDNSIALETQVGLLGGHTVRSDVPSDAVFTDTTYTAGQNVQINGTTISATDTVYDDTALAGRVSTVEGLLDGHSIGKNVPADAVFTDTVYDDTELSSRVTDAEEAIEDLQNTTKHLSDGEVIYPYAPEIEIEDALGVNAKNVKVKIEPVQSGSGTPIIGFDKCVIERSGKNIYTGSPNFEGYLIPSGWAQDGYYNEHPVYKKQTAWNGIYKLVYLPVGTYTFSCMVKTDDNAVVNIFATVSGTTTATINPVNKTGLSTTSNWLKIYFTFSVTQAGTVALRVERTTDGTSGNYLYITEYQLEHGSEPTNFEPYTGYNIYTIDLGDTIYDGELDVSTGVLTLTLTHKFVDLGTLNWEASASVFTTTVPNIKSSVRLTDMKCSNYEPLCHGEPYSSNWDKVIYQANYQTVVIDTNYTDASTFKSAMNGVQLVYELATPITIQLTPQQIQLLDGYNYLKANTGDISITTTDVKGAIRQADELIEANTQAIHEIDSFDDSIFGTVENGTTASKAYAQGDYFVKDKKMCKALTSIAEGATFTLDTNYEPHTLAEILKTIENA